MLDSQRLRDLELIEMARRGDRAAYDDLVRPLRDQIYWRAVKAVGDLDEAEDVTQETLVRGFTRIDTFRGDARFSSWLYQVATNCIRMHLRSKRRRATSSLEDHHMEQDGLNDPGGNEASAALAPPDQLFAESELIDAIESAISNLPPQYGNILRLWVEDGLDLREIHERSGLSIAAIKSRLHRARRRVRAEIESAYGVGALLAA